MAKISNVLRDVFDDDTLQPTEATTAKDVEEWDSANQVRFMVAVESEFGIRFESDEFAAPENVGQVVDMVMAKLAA